MLSYMQNLLEKNRTSYCTLYPSFHFTPYVPSFQL